MDVRLLAPPDLRRPRRLEEIRYWKGLSRESINLRKDGACFPVWLKSEVVANAHGEPCAIVTSCEDITEDKTQETQYRYQQEHLEGLVVALQASEERYRHIVRSITDYIYTVYVKDGEPYKTVHGAASVAVVGYAPEEFDRNPFLWFNIIHPDDRDRAVRFFNEVLRTKQQATIEHRIYHKNGDLRWIANTVVLFKDIEGNVVEYNGVVADITARKRAEEEVQQYREHLEDLVEQRTAQLHQEIEERQRAEEKRLKLERNCIRLRN